MANSSEKQAVKRYHEYRDRYTKITMGIYLAYFLLRVFWWGDSFGTAQWIGLAFLTLVNALTLKTIFSFLELGHPETSFSHFQDIQYTTWFVQATTIFSDWFWLVYLWLPIYAIYAYSSTCLNMLCGQRQQQERPPTEKELKKLEKKERQEKRMAKFAVRG